MRILTFMLNTLHPNAFKMSAVISTVLALQTLTFIQFFLFSPFEAGFNLMATSQFLMQLAWILLILVPPALLYFRKIETSASKVGILIIAVFWPAIILFIRIQNAVSEQDLNFYYLIAYPIFIFSDIIVPIIYVVMAKNLRNIESSSSSERRQARLDETIQAPN